jgi:hypothetical protein
MTDFKGPGTPLSKEGFDAAAGAIDVKAEVLWAVMSVETSGCGFLVDRRPKILFERHVFCRLTGGKYNADDPDISAPSQGGYGKSGAHQYERLEPAIHLDEAAALQSASWGLGQIMGEKIAGFSGVGPMVTAMVAGEDGQFLAMANFIKNSGMDRLLRALDWAGFARRYNGPNYAANRYDDRLSDYYSRYCTHGTPDLFARRAQIGLWYNGFNPCPIDGAPGDGTTKAVQAFQQSKGVAVTGKIDDTLMALLFPA